MDIPAFPTHGQAEGDDPRNQILSGGMTIRDYFAAAALQGLCAILPDMIDPKLSEVAKDAYLFADAMITERNRND